MNALAVIGGTGLTELPGLDIRRRESLNTPWGAPSGPAVHGLLDGCDVVFLARHGSRHTIPPHRVNYRANIWALRELGITHVVGVAAVGAIDPALPPASLVVPDQIIDYTWGRSHTFFEQDLDAVVHVDFTHPYDLALRQAMVDCATEAGCPCNDGGTYAATQGPRLESAAEVRRLARDGCHVVGMTGMPEAALAREAGLGYAHCAVVANPAAGLGSGLITMDQIKAQLEVGMGHVGKMLSRLVTHPSWHSA